MDSMAEDLYARHQRVSPKWVALYYKDPIELVRGEGRHVWDAAGNRYLDFFGGILTTISGHAVTEVVDAIREQAGKLIHTSTLYLSRPMIELAEKIANLSGIADAKVFFTPSGGTMKPPTPWMGSAIMQATSPDVHMSMTSRRSWTQALM